MNKIDKMYAFVATDPNGSEGVMGFMSDGVLVPMVGADMRRIDSLKPFADLIAQKAGVEYKILRFELIGEIEK